MCTTAKQYTLGTEGSSKNIPALSASLTLQNFAKIISPLCAAVNMRLPDWASLDAGDVRDSGSIPGSGRSPGGGNGNPLQYSCLENPMDGGASWAAVHGVARSWTRLSDLTIFSLSCIGEGNGNPLQCSCLENPRDGGASWAAVHGVAAEDLIKNLPAMQETWVQYLGPEDPLEKTMAPHSNPLAWKIPWTEEPRGLQSMGSQRVRDD